MFFTLVKDNDHYFGETEREPAFLQSEAAWMPYSFIGNTHNPGAARGRCVKIGAKVQSGLQGTRKRKPGHKWMFNIHILTTTTFSVHCLNNHYHIYSIKGCNTVTHSYIILPHQGTNYNSCSNKIQIYRDNCLQTARALSKM